VKVLITNVQVYTVSHGVIDKGSVLVKMVKSARFLQETFK